MSPWKISNKTDVLSLLAGGGRPASEKNAELGAQVIGFMFEGEEPVSARIAQIFHLIVKLDVAKDVANSCEAVLLAWPEEYMRVLAEAEIAREEYSPDLLLGRKAHTYLQGVTIGVISAVPGIAKSLRNVWGDAWKMRHELPKAFADFLLTVSLIKDLNMPDDDKLVGHMVNVLPAFIDAVDMQILFENLKRPPTETLGKAALGERPISRFGDHIISELGRVAMKSLPIPDRVDALTRALIPDSALPKPNATLIHSRLCRGEVKEGRCSVCHQPPDMEKTTIELSCPKCKATIGSDGACLMCRKRYNRDAAVLDSKV